jgi:serine/threonine protein kinase
MYRQGLPPPLLLKYSYQLASGLRYLHQDARIVHRDVKLENCVIDRPAEEGGNLRLCDFGLADFLPGDDTPTPRQQYTTPQTHVEELHPTKPDDMVAGGSLAYAAPEQIKSVIPLLDTAIDMWSYGVVVYALVIGELPFSDPFPPKLQDLILKGTWNKDRFLNRVDSEICDVVLGCIKMNPRDRWTAPHVLSSQWIATYSDASLDDRHVQRGSNL